MKFKFKVTVNYTAYGQNAPSCDPLKRLSSLNLKSLVMQLIQITMFGKKKWWCCQPYLSDSRGMLKKFLIDFCIFFLIFPFSCQCFSLFADFGLIFFQYPTDFPHFLLIFCPIVLSGGAPSRCCLALVLASGVTGGGAQSAPQDF